MKGYDSRGARIVSKDSRGERMEAMIIVGSESDMAVARKAEEVLRENKINFETVVASAHRNPKKLDEVLAHSDARVFIGIAGLSAALPGAIAARTSKPVIGVPVNVKLDGLDALLSIMQMPAGVPVATVGIDNAKNAALLAVRILRA